MDIFNTWKFFKNPESLKKLAYVIAFFFFITLLVSIVCGIASYSEENKKFDRNRVFNKTYNEKDGYKTQRLIAYNKGKKHSQDEIRRIRIGTIKYLQNIIKSFQPRYNKKSILFFDQLSKERGWNLQHAENGGEFYTGIGYFVDAYDK